MAISKALAVKLNEQVAVEFSAAFSYLAMACSFDRMGLKVLKKHFHSQYEEELGHALKITHYLQEIGADVVIESVPKPRADFKDAEQIVEAALKNEQDVTRCINELVKQADADQDYATRSFLNWFIDEQVEEESSMGELLMLFKLADGNVLQVENRIRHATSGAQ